MNLPRQYRFGSRNFSRKGVRAYRSHCFECDFFLFNPVTDFGNQSEYIVSQIFSRKMMIFLLLETVFQSKYGFNFLLKT